LKDKAWEEIPLGLLLSSYIPLPRTKNNRLFQFHFSIT